MYARGAEVVVERDAWRVNLQVKGDLDVASMPVLREALTEASADRSCDILLSLDRARIVNTPTVEMFATAVRRVGDSGSRVVVLGVSPMQEMILRTYGLDCFSASDQPALIGR
jgi:anti-anti-sigma factor